MPRLIKWIDASEVVIGFSISGKLPADAINADDIHPTYQELVPLMKKGASPHDLAEQGYLSAVVSCKGASERAGEFSDDSPLKWIDTLKKTASRSTAAQKLERVAKKWENGEDADTADVLQALNQMNEDIRPFTPMSDVTEEADMWVPTGYKPIDELIGGFPKSSLTIMAASPGIGKTSLMLKIANAMARLYTEKKVIIFTLEMTMAMLTRRMMDMDKKLTKDVRKRLLLSETAYTVQEVYAEAVRQVVIEEVSLIAIDFADQLVEGEQSEAVMGTIYRTLSMLAKKSGVPVLLISQLNRATYVGGTPRINHIRYSGMAEAMAALILLIYNPQNILVDYAEKSSLPDVEGYGYIIEGKSRYGFTQGTPGAVQVKWDGLAGWGDKPNGWFPL